MEAIVNNLIRATGWSIFHSLWQGAIIYAILLMCLNLFPKLNARVKHNLAYGTLCLIFMGFCITFSNLFELPAKTVTAAGKFYIEKGQSTAMLSIPSQLKANAEYVFPYLCTVYITGLILQLLILMVGYNKLVQLKKAARIAIPSEWQVVFEQVAQTLNIGRKIGFHLSEQVNVPLVIGYLKPIVLFPVALATQLDIKQVEAILIHELSHIRRNDYLLNLIKTGIETLLFFNPFVWLTSKFIGIEREHACDDMVLKFTGTPLTYAHALLKLEILKDKTAPALSMAVTGNNQHLYQRIKRITNMKTNYMNAKQKFFAITLTLATIVSLAWIGPKKDAIPPAKTVNANHNKKLKSVRVEQIVSSTVNMKSPADTTKKKKVIKIITVDDNGNRKEYNSLKEMPDSLRKEVAKNDGLTIPGGINPDMMPLLMDKYMKLYNLHISGMDSTLKGKALSAEQETKRRAIASELEKSISIALEQSGKSYSKAMEQYGKAIEDAAKVAKSTITYSFKSMPKEGATTVVRDTAYFTTRGVTKIDRQEMEAMREIRESKEYLKAKKKFDAEVEKLKRKKGIAQN